MTFSQQVGSDASQFLRPAKDLLPPEIRDPKKPSIFNIRWLVTAIDEVHEYRTFGKRARAMQALTSRSRGVIGMSATPLFTNSMV
jgi:hypothetical protein